MPDYAWLWERTNGGLWGHFPPTVVPDCGRIALQPDASFHRGRGDSRSPRGSRRRESVAVTPHRTGTTTD